MLELLSMDLSLEMLIPTAIAIFVIRSVKVTMLGIFLTLLLIYYDITTKANQNSIIINQEESAKGIILQSISIIENTNDNQVKINIAGFREKYNCIAYGQVNPDFITSTLKISLKEMRCQENAKSYVGTINASVYKNKQKELLKLKYTNIKLENKYNIKQINLKTPLAVEIFFNEKGHLKQEYSMKEELSKDKSNNQVNSNI